MTSKRGFASMDKEKQRKIASMGGKIAHASGKAHKWTSDEAVLAGRIGGKSSHRSGKAHRYTSEEARAAGKIGGSKPRAGKIYFVQQSTTAFLVAAQNLKEARVLAQGRVARGTIKRMRVATAADIELVRNTGGTVPEV